MSADALPTDDDSENGEPNCCLDCGIPAFAERCDACREYDDATRCLTPGGLASLRAWHSAGCP